LFMSLDEIQKELKSIEYGSFFKSDLERIRGYLMHSTKEEKEIIRKYILNGIKEAIKAYKKKPDTLAMHSVNRKMIIEYKGKLKKLKKDGIVEIEGVVLSFKD